MDHLLLTFEKLDVGAINDLVKDKSCGAVSLFVGTTRDNFDDKEVTSLEYEAYEPMAIKQMEIICKELRAQWTELAHIAIYHRLGCVPVAEESIVIAISSPHRVASLEAVAHAIEQLKKRVPIWKKEQYKNDASAWKENKECTWSTNKQIDIKGLKTKRPRFDAAALNQIESDDFVDNDLIQITAGADEIKRRMQCFIAQKRNEIDYNNIVDYTVIQAANEISDNTKNNNVSNEIAKEEVSTCARVNSLIVKQENSNCHLRVRTVKNLTGPQTKSGYTRTLDKLMQHAERVIKTEPGLEDTKPDIKQLSQRRERVAYAERVRNLEEYLGLNLNDQKSILQKLKIIEDRILYLESVSPEYKHFLTEKSTHANSYAPQIKFSTFGQQTTQNDNISETPDTTERQPFDVEDLDAIIERMEREQEEFNRQPPATTTSSNGSIYEDD